jgi:hypothetical protein
MAFFMKQNDTAPSIRATLENGNGNAIDLTGATVSFHMRALGATQTKVDAAATVVNAASGIVQYNWIAADTNTIGSYAAEFEVRYADNTIETFPNNGYIRVEITDDIA